MFRLIWLLRRLVVILVCGFWCWLVVICVCCIRLFGFVLLLILLHCCLVWIYCLCCGVCLVISGLRTLVSGFDVVGCVFCGLVRGLFWCLRVVCGFVSLCELCV